MGVIQGSARKKPFDHVVDQDHRKSLLQETVCQNSHPGGAALARPQRDPSSESHAALQFHGVTLQANGAPLQLAVTLTAKVGTCAALVKIAVNAVVGVAPIRHAEALRPAREPRRPTLFARSGRGLEPATPRFMQVSVLAADADAAVDARVIAHVSARRLRAVSAPHLRRCRLLHLLAGQFRPKLGICPPLRLRRLLL